MEMVMEHGMTQQAQAKKRAPRLEVTNPNAAGIDIGSASHYVAVPADRDDEPVREFKSFTVDVHKLADWLEACGVDTVAMESTGVYWIPVYEILERRGFTVLLVNARHVKNVAGRKSDVLDCQWLQQLHSYGLLRGAFRPADQIVCVALTEPPACHVAAAASQAHSAHAKGAGADEHSAGQRDL
jgi:transposase